MPPELPDEEYDARIDRACALMQAEGLRAVYLSASSSLLYFTGIKWAQTERLVGAILLPDKSLRFVLPAFEAAYGERGS